MCGQPRTLTAKPRCNSLNPPLVRSFLSSSYLLSDGRTVPVHSGKPGQTRTAVIPRSREVGQSYFTSLFTTLFALLHAVGIVIRAWPELVSCPPSSPSFSPYQPNLADLVQRTRNLHPHLSHCLYAQGTLSPLHLCVCMLFW